MRLSRPHRSFVQVSVRALRMRPSKTKPGLGGMARNAE